jgi:pSer/pThr/pTyr-binding forkhead associated (FHA) protein
MSSDPHLDSVHLDTLRREEFRRVRESILGAVGDLTRRGEQPKPGDKTDAGSTLYHKLEDRIPPGHDFVILDKEKVYQLKFGVNTVGRLSDNDVPIPDPYLSRRHCAILVHAAGNCEIYDVASKNGTFVNGNRIEGRTALKSGDEIRMCDRQYIFLRREEIKDDDLPLSGDRTQTD